MSASATQGGHNKANSGLVQIQYVVVARDGEASLCCTFMITFCVSRRRRKIIVVTRGCLCVCARPHVYTIARTQM